MRCKALKCIFAQGIYVKMWVGIIRATSILMCNIDFVSKAHNICVAVSEWPFVCDHSSHLVSSFFEFTSVQPPTQLPNCVLHSLCSKIFSEFEYYIICIYHHELEYLIDSNIIILQSQWNIFSLNYWYVVYHLNQKLIG